MEHGKTCHLTGRTANDSDCWYWRDALDTAMTEGSVPGLEKALANLQQLLCPSHHLPQYGPFEQRNQRTPRHENDL